VTGGGLRRVVRALPGLVAVAAVFDLAVVHAALIGHYPLLGDPARVGWEVAYALLLVVCGYMAGVADPPRRRLDAVVAAAVAVVAAALTISLVQLAVGSAVLPRFVVFGAALVLGPSHVALARLSDRVRRSHEQLDRVVAVVSSDEALALERDLEQVAERPATLAATVTVDDARPGRTAQPLVALASEVGATVLVLDRTAQSDEAVVAQAAVLHGAGVRVRTLSLFYDEWLGKLPVGELERVSLMFDIQELHHRQYARVKRLVDVVVALAGCLVLAGVAPIVAVCDLVGNRGPLLFRQQRVGRNGTPFTMLKFRTMPPTAAPSEPELHTAAWTEPDDVRLGRVGRWLRATHLDELPQVLNVLRGELSLVGPRPEQPGYVAELRRKVPFYDVRHLVHPGLTGWAQVKFPYGASVADAVEKLQYEFFYLRHQSLRLDLRILARTVRSVVAASGR
jgi:lipopolysaccharide/colanic/teichoic acid biosynthesis glycosyltransferase